MRCTFATESDVRLSAGLRADFDPGVREVNVAKEDRGFASMDPNKQREIASKGGKAAHQKGTAHEWTSEEARNAGRKGGLASHRRRREQQEGGAASESSEAGGGDWSGEAAGGGGSE
jgi:general stress protein YciG